jgi:hypothetical protein
MEARRESQSTERAPNIGEPHMRRLGTGVFWIGGLRIGELVRSRRAWLAVLALVAGAWMRLAMLKALPQITGDTLLYGGLARNLLLHHAYALTDANGVRQATLIRLPGYPLFLALCFKLFGVDYYSAVSYVQMTMELAGCLLLADFVRRISVGTRANPNNAALWTLWLGALCPFTAAYAVAPLTETPTLFTIALALWAMTCFHTRPAWWSGLAFTFAVTFAALLRPDGALLGVALVPALWLGLRPPVRSGAVLHRGLVRMGVVCLLLALLPFAVWTARNWRVFHVIEPLAPRYATDPGEATNPGFQRWMKTWCLDFVSTNDIYWNVPGSPLEIGKLPARAFDSPGQYAETASVLTAYNNNGADLSAQMDDEFAQLAAERIHANPLRYYLWLPLGRVADMTLRPRVENLNIDSDWWVASHHYAETRFSWAYAALNAAYFLLAAIGLCFRPRYWPWMVLYVLTRGALLTTIEAPEARYTLEYFPMVFALGGLGIAAGWQGWIGRRRNQTNYE